MPEIAVSIIIPAFNRRSDLQRCLDSIRQHAGAGVEVIVIDDSSDLSHADLCADDDIYIRNATNLGPAYSRNLAAIQANGRILLFMDSDVEILPGAIPSMVALLDSAQDIGCVGGCGPANSSGNDVDYVKTKYYASSGKNRSLVRTAEDFASVDTIECDHFESANLAIRKSVFEQLGGFDPYWFYMGEDRELCLRLRRAGYRVLVAWNARAIHHERELDEKRREVFRAFLAKRFLEVAFKLDGYPGALRWILSNRDQLAFLRPVDITSTWRRISELKRRRRLHHLDSEHMQEYLSHVAAQQQR